MQSMEDSVLVDHRTYRVKPGMTQAHLDIYEKHGFAAQTRHLGQPLAYMFAETGEHQHHRAYWAYEDAADRAKPARRHDGRSGMADLLKKHRRRAIWSTADHADDPGQVRADQALTREQARHARQ